MTAIKQLQLSYSADEDRILLRVNTTSGDEFRFWLTRRFSILMIEALEAHRAVDPDVSAQTNEAARQAIQEFKREEATSQGNFQEEFTQSENFPLGDVPILAHKLTYGVSGMNLNLSIEPRSGQGINIVLDPQLNHNVSKLLRSAAETAQWGLVWQEEGTEVPEPRVVN